MSLSAPLLQALANVGYEAPSPIQAAAIPALLDGRDLVGQAQTGTGKTAAFALPALTLADMSLPHTQVLVLTPTRELAIQVAEAFQTYAANLPGFQVLPIYGGQGYGAQLQGLRRGAHVVVATPGRLIDHLERGTLDLSHLKMLVLDEADRMLDMGFEEPIRKLLKRMPSQRQTLLFSATYPDEIRNLAQVILRDPAQVTVEGGAQPATIQTRFFEADPKRRAQQLAALLLQFRPESTVVFCNMRKDTEALVGSLAHYGFTALALHGDMEQRDRDEVLVRFANRSCNVLVASDVAARGLDIDDIGAVVNFELPTGADTYLHRVGRTGRVGRGGLALSLVAPQERSRAALVEERQGTPIHYERIAPLEGKPRNVPQAAMTTLRIDAGRTAKLRPGDIVGALTGEAGLDKDAIGKIDVFATRSYVAIAREHARHAVAQLRTGKIKGRKFRVSLL